MSELSGKNDKKEARKLRKEAKKLAKAARRLKAAKQSVGKPKEARQQKRKRKKNALQRRPDPFRRGLSLVRQVDERLARAWAAHIMFPDYVPPARIPDDVDAHSAIATSKFELAITQVTDGKAAANAYWGLAMTEGAKSQFYYLSAAGTTTAGDFTWTALDNPKQGTFGSNTHNVRNLGTHVAIKNITNISSMQGRWLVARIHPTELQTSSSGGILPLSISALTVLRSCRECVANAPDSGGISLSHLHSRADGNYAYFDPTAAYTTQSSAVTVIVWAGSSSGSLTQNIVPYFTTTFEHLPFQDTGWLFQLESWMGSKQLVGQAYQTAQEMWSACGCTEMERKTFFKKLFGAEAPATSMDIGDSNGTIGIALQAKEHRSRLRHIVAHLTDLRECADKKEMSSEIIGAVTLLAQCDLSEPLQDEKMLVSRKELTQLVREMAWLEDPPEEKRSARSQSTKPR